MISEEELTSLLSYIEELEAQIANLVAERRGVSSGSNDVRAVTGPVPEGYSIGARGQLVATSSEAAWREIQASWPYPESALRPRKRVRPAE